MLRVSKSQLISKAPQIFSARKQGIPIEVTVENWKIGDHVYFRSIWNADRILFKLKSFSDIRRFLKAAPPQNHRRIYFAPDGATQLDFWFTIRLARLLRIYQDFSKLPRIILLNRMGNIASMPNFKSAPVLLDQAQVKHPIAFNLAYYLFKWPNLSIPDGNVAQLYHVALCLWVRFKDAQLGRAKHLLLRFGLKPIYFLNY